MNVDQGDPDFEVARNAIGDLISAQRRDGSAAMYVARESGGALSTCRVHFDFDQGSLDLTGQINREEEAVQLEAHSAEVAYLVRADFSQYESRHLGEITGLIQGWPVVGVYDPLSRRTTAAIGLDYWLPDSTHRKLGLLAPLLRVERERYRTMQAPFDAQIEQTIRNSRWRAIGKAGCWGMGSMMGAAICMSTGGIGCLAGAFVFGGAASLCDQML